MVVCKVHTNPPRYYKEKMTEMQTCSLCCVCSTFQGPPKFETNPDADQSNQSSSKSIHVGAREIVSAAASPIWNILDKYWYYRVR